MVQIERTSNRWKLSVGLLDMSVATEVTIGWQRESYPGGAVGGIGDEND